MYMKYEKRAMGTYCGDTLHPPARKNVLDSMWAMKV
jgi:hypothetical protein